MNKTRTSQDPFTIAIKGLDVTLSRHVVTSHHKLETQKNRRFRQKPTIGAHTGARPDLQDLSFILHPSHEKSSPEQERVSNFQGSVGDQYKTTILEGAAAALGVTLTFLDHM